MNQDKKSVDDLRLIKLCRQAIGYESDEIINQNSFFATDYFDTLEQIPMTFKEPLPKILGISDEKVSKQGKIAMQGYTLYASAAMQREFEGAHTKRKYAGNPFESNFPFLSIIQVHITPEIFARINLCEVQSEKESIILKIFIDDIYSIIDETVIAEPWLLGKFIGRIYHQLSSGDFAVVIKSQEAVISYYISTAIRKRVLKLNGAEHRIVIYKTYTLLVIDDYIINQGNEQTERSTKDNVYIIRGAFSNKYWGMSEDERLNWNNDFGKIEKDMHKLNGRYDFSLELSEKSFIKLLPFFKKYKNNLPIDDVSFRFKGMEHYMIALMKHRYISCINERFLLHVEEVDQRESISPIISEYAVKNQENRQYIEEINDNKIVELKNSYAEFMHEFSGIKGYRKNLKHYLILLNKEIDMCTDINKLSDTRIYATVQLEQLEIIIFSLKRYLTIYLQSGENQDIMDRLEQYLQKAVYMLDQYAQYIRNNNLQSLQTPNYNIETSTGMDKLLIAYSELLRVFMNYYLENCGLDCSQKFLPVMVPDLQEGAVHVEVLFPSIILDNKVESVVKKYLLVVNSATLAELSDIPVMLVSLFHEVAHQFRYEERTIRNNTLLEYVLPRAFAPTAERMLNQFLYYNDVVVEEHIILNLLIQSMKEAVLKLKKNGLDNSYEYPYQDVPLSNFFELFSEDVIFILSSLGKNNHSRKLTEAFIKEVVRGGTVNDQEIISSIKRIRSAIHSLQAANESSCKEVKEQVINKAFDLAVVCAGKIHNTDMIVKTEKIHETYYEEWTKRYGMEIGSNTTGIWKSFLLYANKMWAIDKNDDDPETIFQYIYEIASTKWQKQLYACINAENNGAKGDYLDYIKMPSYHNWAAIGRYWGLDQQTKENYERFKRSIREAVDLDISPAVEEIMKYREETADLFMLSIVPMKPFGYVHLMVKNLPSGNTIYDTYVQRIVRVIYAKWCVYEKQQFFDICEQIVRDLFRFAGADFQNEKKCFERNLQLHQDISIECMVQLFIECISQVAEKAEAIRTNSRISKDNHALGDDKGESLFIVQKVCVIMDKVIRDGNIYIDEFEQCNTLKEDYARGVIFWKRFQAEKMDNSSNAAITKINHAAKELAEYLNDPEIQFDHEESRGRIHLHCIRLMLQMYYNNKIFYADKAVSVK